MVFHAAIDILPLPALLDPQGKAVSNNLPNMGLGQLTNVRIGKHITLDIEAGSREEAEKLVAEACEKLLSNPIMERFEFRVFSAEEAAL
ncbi:phosphoribosylformylglycinamidine synthase subunit PurS [Flavobacteriales bacterium]|jgi:phosphoribosylformylglycinamidine synthase|nr:phosphoribosylformylglycinamidine synthase subunit PurS [Flavobacteriales bacterium]